MIYADKNRQRITADTTDELTDFLESLGIGNASNRSSLRLPPALYKKCIATGKVTEVDTTFGKAVAPPTKTQPSKPSLALRKKLQGGTLEEYFTCERCNNTGEYETNIDGADVMCICQFCCDPKLLRR